MRIVTHTFLAFAMALQAYAQAAQPNAAEGYRYAWAILRPTDLAAVEAHFGRDEPLPEDVKHILDSGPTPKAVRYLLMAADIDRCEWPDDPAIEPGAEAHVSEARHIALLLAVDAERCRREGKVDDAARRTGAIVRLATHTQATTAGRGPDLVVWVSARSILDIARQSLDADLAAPPTHEALTHLLQVFEDARESLLISERDVLEQVAADLRTQRAAMRQHALDAKDEQAASDLKRADALIDDYLASTNGPDAEADLEKLRATCAEDMMCQLTLHRLDAARRGWYQGTASITDDLDHAHAVITAALKDEDS